MEKGYVPSNITFAQMALILEELLEYPKSDRIEFEFYQKKLRLIEWNEEDHKISDTNFDYLNAPDTFVNSIFNEEKWFTFRIRDKGIDIPEYRIEIEKLFETVTFKEGAKELSYPILLLEKFSENDEYWKRNAKINDYLKENYSLHEEQPRYLYFNELLKEIEEKHTGIGYSLEMIDRNIHSSKSLNSQIAEIADMISMKIAADSSINVKEEIKEAFSGYFPQIKQKRNSTIEGMLSVYTKAELQDMAKDYHLEVSGFSKGKTAYEIARHLLLPESMRKYFLDADEAELDAFEGSMEQKLYLPDEDEMMLLDCLKAFDMIHVVAPINVLYQMYQREKMCDVPYDEFIELYEKIPKDMNPCCKIDEKIVSKQVLKDNLYKRLEVNQRDVEYYIPSRGEILSYVRSEYPAENEAYKRLWKFLKTELDYDSGKCDGWCISNLFNGQNAFGFYESIQ